jgi:copper oxidase (laccase) domain-containing protein
MTHTSPITIPGFGESTDGIRHFFGTRQGDGTSSSGTAAVVSVRQIHGTDALVLDRPVRPQEVFPGGWDALVTNQPGVLVTVRTADCVPVLVHDSTRRVVAAIHAGWRGAVAGIVPKSPVTRA